MQTQYINEILSIPELHISQILFVDHNQLHVDATSVAHLQSCPICLSVQHVIRKGNNGTRTVRHLSVFKRKSYLPVPAIRLFCTTCHAGFGWTYEFVGHKQRYSKLFRSLAVEQALGSTAMHSARMQQAPTSTVQRLHQEAVPQISEQMQAKAWVAAKTMTGLVLGVDDFAIKKGRIYNTGIHNLRGETMQTPLVFYDGLQLELLTFYDPDGNGLMVCER